MLESYKFTFGFLGWLALITFLSLYSFSEFQDVDFEIPHLDKAIHLIFYFIGAFLGCLFVRERTRGSFPIRRASIFIALFMTIYGLVIELLQSSMPIDRNGEFYDFLANLSGILMAILLVNFLFSPKTGLNWEY